MIARALAVALVLFAGPARAQSTLRPVDEASKRPAFAAFRDSLRAALARHDTGAVLAVTDPNIKLGFGGDDGRAVLEKQLRAADSKSWRDLAETLALGGTFSANGQFVAPYVYSRWPEAIDAFQHVAITGSGVRVRARPSPRGAVVERLSYAIVALPTGGPGKAPPGWTAIRRANGARAYVASQFVRSPVGYRAFFAPDGASWKLALFVSGD